jgi:hypothetical protein
MPGLRRQVARGRRGQKRPGASQTRTYPDAWPDRSGRRYALSGSTAEGNVVPAHGADDATRGHRDAVNRQPEWQLGELQREVLD